MTTISLGVAAFCSTQNRSSSAARRPSKDRLTRARHTGHQTSELCHQDGSLPFAATVIRTVDEMAVEPLSRHTATIMDGTGLTLESVVVGNDDAAFTGGHQLAGLKTKPSADAERAPSLPAPFTGVRVGRQSSTRAIPLRAARSLKASRSAGCPPMWTAMIAFVWG
jgi:hypothetical protein